MASSCKQQQERVEETVLQPIEEYVEELEEKCRDEPCNWWMLCANKLVCWVVTVLVKVVVWVSAVVVRWVYRIVCTVVSLVIGLVALVFGNTDIIGQALLDLWELAKDAFFTIVGVVILGAINLVDAVQSALGIQQRKRKLTEAERALLRRIFSGSLFYDAISIIPGSAGILGISGRAFTIGFNIYFPNYSEKTLVHECVHVWQFQYEGTKYIGQSAIFQLGSILAGSTNGPYAWFDALSRDNASWYTLESVEAQAKFVDDVFTEGEFIFADVSVPTDTSDGAFFTEDAKLGRNRFEFDSVDFTNIANDAWRILRTG